MARLESDGAADEGVAGPEDSKGAPIGCPSCRPRRPGLVTCSSFMAVLVDWCP